MVIVIMARTSPSISHRHGGCGAIIIINMIIASLTSSLSSDKYCHHLQSIPIVITSLSSWSLSRRHHHYQDDCAINLVIIITSSSSLPLACPHHHHQDDCAINVVMIITSLSSLKMACPHHHHIVIVIIFVVSSSSSS